jgi:hypothetical protein
VLLFAFDLSSTHDIYLGQFAQFDLRPRVGHIAGVRPALVGLIAQIVGLFGHGGIIEQGRNRGCAKLLSATSLGRSYFGGCSSLFSQPVAFSDCSGSGSSQSRHWNVRRPLPPGGTARIKKAPQPGQVGRSARPMGTNFAATPELRQFQNRSDPRMIIPKFYEFAGTVFWLADLESCRAAPGIFQPKNGLCVPRAGAVSLCSAESEPPTVLQLILR